MLLIRVIAYFSDIKKAVEVVLCIQFPNKTYVNRVTLREQNLSFRCCQSLLQKLCKQWGQDLSKEVLWVCVL